MEQAQRYTDILTATFAALAEAPMTTPACDQIRRGYRRRNVERYAVYFRVMPYGIAVIRILHGRPTPPVIFPAQLPPLGAHITMRFTG